MPQEHETTNMPATAADFLRFVHQTANKFDATAVTALERQFLSQYLVFLDGRTVSEASKGVPSRQTPLDTKKEP